MKKYFIRIFSVVGIIAVSFLFSGCGTQKEFAYKVDLEIWGMFDDSDAYVEIINEYKRINSHIGVVTFRKFTADSYKQDILEALASGKGPDIFMIHDTWLPSFSERLEPSPENMISPQQFVANFVDVVADDFVAQGKIYALPLSVDSLALYYNKDLFNSEGVTTPPANWDEFYQAAGKMTKRNSYGNFDQSGAAIGTAYNINRSPDILSLLMLQGGAKMTDEKTGNAIFDQAEGSAGQKALGLYTDFARVSSPAYSWNKSLPDSLTVFAEGKTAMMLNYSWQYEAIRSRNAKLNFAVAPVPQLNSSQKVNFANYWGYAVTKHKDSAANPDDPSVIAIPDEVRTLEAWQFLKYLTFKNNGKITLKSAASGQTKDFPINFDPALAYLKKTGKPAARRDIIEMQKNDLALAPFAEGNLIAKSWRQYNPDAVDRIFMEMIDSVNRGSSSVSDAVSLGAQRVNQTMQ